MSVCMNTLSFISQSRLLFLVLIGCFAVYVITQGGMRVYVTDHDTSPPGIIQLFIFTICLYLYMQITLH